MPDESVNIKRFDDFLLNVNRSLFFSGNEDWPKGLYPLKKPLYNSRKKLYHIELINTFDVDGNMDINGDMF